MGEIHHRQSGVSPARLGLRWWWVGPAYLSNSKAAVPGVATEPSVSIRAARERLPPCHKLGTARTSASVVFFGFRESSCTRRRQSAPRFFPPGNQCGSRLPLVSLRKSRLCVLHPAIPPRKFHSSSLAGSERRRSRCELGLAACWESDRLLRDSAKWGPRQVRAGGAFSHRNWPGRYSYLFLFIHEKWQ